MSRLEQRRKRCLRVLRLLLGSKIHPRTHCSNDEKASETIHALKLVTFRYKKDLDPDASPQFGLVAEQVEKIDPDLVARDDHGKPYTVRYEAVNTMLLNEFLKEHRKVEALEATVAVLQKDFESQIAALTAALKAQAAQIQKVSAGLRRRLLLLVSWRMID